MDKSNSDNGRSGKIREIIELVNKSPLSSIKQTMTEILRVIETESSNARDLKNTIEKDPPLCAGLLKIANSSSYGYPRTISDIQEAIICIGFDAVKELVLNQKLCELFRAGEHMNGYSRQSLWKHSAAVAVCSKMIFRREFRERGYNAYVAGLLHDIGIIVEDQLFRKEFRLALELAAQSKNNLYCIENEVLLVNHADIGRAIAENWSFPAELEMSIGFHHEPDLVEQEYKRIVLTVFIADYLCQRENIGYSDAPYGNVDLFYYCLNELKISKRAIDIIAEELKVEIDKMNEKEMSTL